MKNSFLLLLAASSLVLAADLKKQPLPKPYATPSASNGAKIIPQPEGKKLQAPEGFVVEEYAANFKKPRFMVQLPNGTVLVSDSVAQGSIIAIGADKQAKPLLTGLDRPSNMALWKDYLYVAEAQSIKRYKLDPKTNAAGAGEEVVSLKGYEKGHWTRSLAFDKKGEKLYVGVGSGSNVDPGDPKNRAAVNVYNPDGSNPAIFATGLRNPVSIRFHPKSQVLWTTVQERDGLGDELVPDFFTSVKQGAFYGWPYAYIGPNEEPRNAGKAPELVKQSIEPDVLLQAHSAAMDFAFYNGKAFPSKYRNGAFIALHGSNNRVKRIGYSVVFVPFKGGKPAGEPEDFLTGWMLGPDQREVWGRPVGVLALADGSLLVSEDGNNKIWRVSFQK